MKPETILTQHPHGKTGRNITKEKYDVVKETMLEVLQGNALTHNELMTGMNNRLAGKFEGNIGWYTETVKLDLEARQVIERTPTKPQTYKLK